METLGHGALPGGIEVVCIFDLEPFLAVIGGGGSGCGGHRVSCLYLTYHDCSGEGTAGATSKLDTPSSAGLSVFLDWLPGKRPLVTLSLLRIVVCAPAASSVGFW